MVSAIPQPVVDVRSSTPSLTASLSQVNSTHITVSLLNGNPFDIIILTQHSFIEDSVEHRSFSIIPTSGGQKLTWGVKAIRPWYIRSTIENSLAIIPAASTYSKTFDITEAFHVPKTGSYHISFQDAFRGMNAEQHPGRKLAITDLTTIKVDSKEVTFLLAASKPKTLVKRYSEFNYFSQCPPGDERNKLKAAIRGARVMANLSIAMPHHNALYEFFGVDIQTDPEAYAQIEDTFRKISLYNFRTNYDLAYTCDPYNSLGTGCTNAVLGFYDYPEDRITTCRDFFDSYRSANCVYPNKTEDTVDDQQSTILHEFTHVVAFSPQDVVDHPDPFEKGYDCYNYQCATYFAKNRDEPGAQLPERSAINFEMYAQVVRYYTQERTCVDANGVAGAPRPGTPTALQADQKQG